MRSISIDSKRVYYGILLFFGLITIAHIIKNVLLFVPAFFHEVPSFVVPILQSILYLIVIASCFFQRSEFPKMRIWVLILLFVLDGTVATCYNYVILDEHRLAQMNPLLLSLVSVIEYLFLIAVFIIAASRYLIERRKKG